MAHEIVNAVTPQQDTEKDSDSRENVSAAAVAIPPGFQGPQPPHHPHKSRRHRQECRERWKLRIEFATLVILFAYTTVTFLQWLQMRWSLEQSNRAWMVYRSLSGPGETNEERRTLLVSDGRLSLMAEFVNVGDSPALDVIVRPGHMILDSDVPLSCKTNELPGAPASRAIVPNNSQDLPLRTEIVIDSFTPEILRAITETKTKRLIVGGLVEYKDVFLHPRRTNFCLSYAPDDKVVSFHYCPCLNWAE